MINMRLVIFLFTVFIFLLGIMLGINIGEKNITIEEETRTIKTFSYDPLMGEDYSVSSIVVPAVDEEGKGVSTVLTVQISPGKGRTLANIDRLLFWTDTQNSIRTSKAVAENLTGINLSAHDVIYTIETEAAAVEGPSAGAALTIVTIAALQRKMIRSDVMITGAINHDGTIGPVGNIMEKALSAKESGATLFLVPLSLSEQVTYKEIDHCEQIGSSELCTKERIPERISVEEVVGIEVEEVKSVSEALSYFFED